MMTTTLIKQGHGKTHLYGVESFDSKVALSSRDEQFSSSATGQINDRRNQPEHFDDDDDLFIFIIFSENINHSEH